ncbi:hypothetical protein [Sciscionella sediminilitoris]|uniref:hypothetical protein n=1 Tax=Sciscionella sediminilitoris TaxID=1445613 RepID=UPI0004DFB441|nr:hypothetical protein [Sciscionella sp. SE31]
MSSTDITRLHETIGQLRACVGSLRSQLGDSPGVRRLYNDLERLDIDASEVAGPRGRVRPVPEQERVRISDTPYDPDLWADADDEGVGGSRVK